MKLDIYFLFFVWCFLQMANGEERDKSASISNQPATLQARLEKHAIEKKSPEKKESSKRSDTKKPKKEKEEVIVHNHGDRNYYESEASEYKPKEDPYDFDKEYNDDTFDKYLNYFKANLENPEDDGYKTSKSVHTEHFEIKELNPKASTPEEKYIIRGGYKVQETDPFGSNSKKTHLHTYDSPLSKIAASIYSKFDYLNFPNNNDDDSEEELDGEEKEEDPDKEATSEEKDEEDYYGNEYPSYEKEDGYDDDDTDSAEDDEDEKKESSEYNTRPNTKEKKSENNEETRATEYLTPFPTDIDTIYSKDWKKYIMELVYGDFEDYHSPSNMYEVRLRAKRKV